MRKVIDINDYLDNDYLIILGEEITKFKKENKFLKSEIKEKRYILKNTIIDICRNIVEDSDLIRIGEIPEIKFNDLILDLAEYISIYKEFMN